MKFLDGSNPRSDEKTLAEWTRYFKELLKNNNTCATSSRPATADLPIRSDPPTLEERIKAIKGIKRKTFSSLDNGISREALKDGAEEMTTYIHAFCEEVYAKKIGNAPSQWITNLIEQLPKGDLSLKKNHRGITLMSVVAKVYNRRSPWAWRSA